MVLDRSRSWAVPVRVQFSFQIYVISDPSDSNFSRTSKLKRYTIPLLEIILYILHYPGQNLSSLVMAEPNQRNKFFLSRRKDLYRNLICSHIQSGNLWVLPSCPLILSPFHPPLNLWQFKVQSYCLFLVTSFYYCMKILKKARKNLLKGWPKPFFWPRLWNSPFKCMTIIFPVLALNISDSQLIL